ncbi:unnamed protein product [Pylaiella littoralis]
MQAATKSREPKLNCQTAAALLGTPIHCTNPEESPAITDIQQHSTTRTTKTMPKKKEACYDPARPSAVGEDTHAEYVRAPIKTGDITEVPGIAGKAAGILAEGEGDDRVTNTYQLYGKFLSLRGPEAGETHEVDSVEHCEKFYLWLQGKGINACRDAIVRAVAEKSNNFFPGLYDSAVYTNTDK